MPFKDDEALLESDQGPDSITRQRKILFPLLAAALLSFVSVQNDPAVSAAAMPASLAMVALAGFFGGLVSSAACSVVVSLFYVYLFGGTELSFSPADLTTLFEMVCAASLLTVSTAVLRSRAEGIFSERRSRKEADEALGRFKDMVDNLDVAIWEALATQPPTFKSMGEGVEAITGFTAKDFISDEGLWFEHIHPADRELVTKSISEAALGGGAMEIEYRFITATGETVWINDLVRLAPSSGGPEAVIQGRMFDVTESKRAERRLAVVHSATVGMNESRSINEAAPRILRAICESLGWQLGILWDFHEDDDQLRVLETWHDGGPGLAEFADTCRKRAFSKGFGQPGIVWETRAPLWVADVLADETFTRSRSAEGAGVHGAFAFPIMSGREFLGVFEFFSNEIEEPDEELLIMMGSIGGRIGQYLETIKAEEATRISEARKSAILESALDCIITIDAEGRILEFNPAAEKTFGFARDDVVGETLESTIIPPSKRAPHRAGLKRLLATGESKIIGQRVEMPALRADGSEILVEVSVSRVESEGPPMFSGYLRDITEWRKAEDAKIFLAKASDVLASSLDYEPWITQICDMAMAFFGGHCVIDLVDEDQTISRVAASGEGKVPKPLHPLLERYLSDSDQALPIVMVLNSGLPIAESGEPAFMIAPLVARGKVIGSIGVAGSETGGSYAPEDLDTLEDLAKRISRALYNAFEYRRESNIASILQKSLIPELPTIPGIQIGEKFLPAGQGNEVGGDFFDLFRYGQGHWAVVIGDVSGKGPQAARLAGVVKNTVRAEALQEREPARILVEVNSAILSQKTSEAQFCTVAYARLDATADGAHVTVVAGGHPLPLVLRADGSVESAGEPGTLLGLFQEVSLRERFLSLGPGDALLFFTDGVIEARSDSDIYTETRLRTVFETCLDLSAQSIADGIAESINEFSKGSLRDDVAVLVVKIPRGA